MRAGRLRSGTGLPPPGGAAAAAGVLPGESHGDALCARGDLLVVWKLDRLGCNLAHLVNTVPDLQEDAAQAAAVRGEHSLGDAADREHCRGWVGDSAPDAPEIIYCTAVAEPVGLMPEPAAGRADAKAARHGRPTAARKR